MKVPPAVVLSLLLASVATVRGVALVLGSGGLIGGVLVRHLVRAGIRVEQVRNRRHIDLRVRGALDVFNRSDIQYCFFLACEVGGSKFLEDSDPRVQLGILESNLRMYQSVLPWLAEHRVPFAFTSSYLQGTQNPYGVVKRLGEQWVRHLGTQNPYGAVERLGEQWVRHLGLGRTFRLWNVYGPETTGPKSHVLSDWATACVRDGVVHSRTDGHEVRQFVHVEDVADALVRGMSLHARLPIVSDVSSGEWVAMRVAAAQLEAAVRAVPGLHCHIRFAGVPAAARARLSPQLDGVLHGEWRSRISLPEGAR